MQNRMIQNRIYIAWEDFVLLYHLPHSMSMSLSDNLILGFAFGPNLIQISVHH